MSGLLPTGFIAPTTTAIKTSIESDELSLIDPALNLSPTQPLGQMNGIWASSASSFWTLAQAVYAALDPSAAVGVQLDNLCAITGCTRLAASKTQVNVSINLTAGTGPFPAGTLIANVVGYPQFTFTNRDAIASPIATGAYSAVFLATQTGPIACNASTLTVITSPVGGWNSITNAVAGTLGTNIETDTALRIRRAQLLVASGGSSIDSIRSSLLSLPGMLQAVVLENITDNVDIIGQPPHSFQAVIWDGPSPVVPNVSIAQAIWNSKPAGIRSFGTTGATALDALGGQRTMNFTRVTQVPIYFAVTVRTSLLFDPINGPTAIKNALVAQGLLQTPGQIPSGIFVPPYVTNGTVYALQYEAAVLTVPGVIDVTSFALDITASPVATANIGISPTQIATVAPANITVTVT